VNSKTAQLTKNGTEIVRLFARFALGASFLSAVADRFGLWGPYGAKNVSWGNFVHFVEYTGEVTGHFPSSLTVSFAWAATVAETLFGILLIAGFKTRMVSVLSGLLLLSFAMGMGTGLGIKSPFDYSVFSAAAAAFLLAFWEPDRFTLDKLLNRLRNSRKEDYAMTINEVEALIKAKTRNRVRIHHLEERIGDSVAFLSYSIDDQNKMTIWHTAVPASLQHMGIGGKLVEEAVQLTSRDSSGLRIVCPFAKEHLARHPKLKERYAVAEQALIEKAPNPN